MSESLLDQLGTELLWQVVGSVLALVVAVWAGLAPVQRQRRAPTVLLAGAAIAGLLPVLSSRVLFVGWGDPSTLALRATTYAALFLLAPLTAGPTVSLTMMMGAVAGARSTPRAWGRTAAMAALATVAGAIVAGVAWQTGNPLYGGFRGVVYAVYGSLLAVGAMGSGPESEGGTDGAVACASLFPIAVGLGEASERGLVLLILSQQTANVEPAKWDTAVGMFREVVHREHQGSMVVLAVAAVAALVGAVRPGDGLVRSLTGALVGIAVGGAVFAASDLSPARLSALSALCTGAP